MKSAIILHGRPDKDEYYDPKTPSESNLHWIPWLQKHLIINDVLAQTPEMPCPFAPRYPAWKREFERFDIGPETLLMGHSCGGGFMVRWLSENKKVRTGKVVLVAPWINPDNNPVSDTADFFDFEIDTDIVSRTAGITIFNSDNDKESVQKSVRIIRDKVKDIEYREFQKRGHFCVGDMGVEFPELLKELLP